MAEMERPDTLPTGGWVLDAFEVPRWLDLEAFVDWRLAADHQLATTGWSPSWLCKDLVRGLGEANDVLQ